MIVERVVILVLMGGIAHLCYSLILALDDVDKLKQSNEVLRVRLSEGNNNANSNYSTIMDVVEKLETMEF